MHCWRQWCFIKVFCVFIALVLQFLRTRTVGLHYAMLCSFANNICRYLLYKHTERLHIVTWNVATAEPPEDITSLLQLDIQPPADLYVIG